MTGASTAQIKEKAIEEGEVDPRLIDQYEDPGPAPDKPDLQKELEQRRDERANEYGQRALTNPRWREESNC